MASLLLDRRAQDVVGMWEFVCFLFLDGALALQWNKRNSTATYNSGEISSSPCSPFAQLFPFVLQNEGGKKNPGFPCIVSFPTHSWAPRTCNQMCLPRVVSRGPQSSSFPSSFCSVRTNHINQKDDIYRKQRSAIGARQVGKSVAGKQQIITICVILSVYQQG